MFDAAPRPTVGHGLFALLQLAGGYGGSRWTARRRAARVKAGSRYFSQRFDPVSQAIDFAALLSDLCG